MRLCRFDDDRLGLVEGEFLRDVTAVLADLPARTWSRPPGDPVMARLDELRPRIAALAGTAPRLSLADVALAAPVATPSKIIGAPVNFRDHLEEARFDRALHQDRAVHPIDEIGCFLKANSALAGPNSTVPLPPVGGRVDHEGEVAVVIGRPGRGIAVADAMAHVAGYTLALDMTVRGPQDRSLRKSCDGFAVIGPWLVTADALAEPAAIAFTLAVNGQPRQHGRLTHLIRSVPELIAMVSAFYTLHPGDVIMTGTPAGVGPVAPDDRITVVSELLGSLCVTVAAARERAA